MTLYRRIKDYCDRRKAHYHLERVAFPSEEPTEEDLRGEDAEAIEMNRKYQTHSPDRDSREQLSYGESGAGNLDIAPSNVHEVSVKAVSPTENKQDINRQKGQYSEEHLGIGALTKEDIRRLEGKV